MDVLIQSLPQLCYLLESLDRINKIERQCWRERLSYKEQLEIKMLPNFDEDIFREITGIDITKKLLNK